MSLPGTAGTARRCRDAGSWQPWCDLKLTLRYIVRERLLRRSAPLGVVGSASRPPALAVAMLLVDRSGVGLVLLGLGSVTLLLSVARIGLLPMREAEWGLS